MRLASVEVERASEKGGIVLAHSELLSRWPVSGDVGSVQTSVAGRCLESSRIWNTISGCWWVASGGGLGCPIGSRELPRNDGGGLGMRGEADD